ncbi:DUF3817 domain-containing protein [Demequina zhanjiangensis]|uniref:DUF3817 domain-containing protein n=1 Tax=Demequina zhanjiangensis TaxID=3051659 RepID=A0ABT8FXF1_9MICO|nr:DUF3817 domain-containing protein [Demequina sp. SYSU T00b26]MDN4471583.1 DUF3817 domain-containing protein [Demequina sp. SYSU T00b26]
MTDPAAEPETTAASDGARDPKLAGALTRYRAMAIITGVFLITVFVGLLRYLPFIDLTDGPVDSFFSGVAIIHGWIYVAYLITVVMLWSRMRWGLGRLIYMAAGGVVPLLSFFAERRIAREVAGSVNP